MSVERILSIGICILFAGCGSLVDGDYRGEVLYEIDGLVYVDDLEIEGDIGVALLWSVETESTGGSQSVVVKTQFPARYTIQIFEPPDADNIVSLFGDDSINAAVGDIILYEDLDQNGVWDRDNELIVGGAFDASVIWVERIESVGLALSPEGEVSALQEGFNLVYREAPFSCITPWDQWLEPALDRRANLQVSYYFPSSFDWNCDGVGEWQDPAQAPTEWFESECDPDIFQAECDLYAEIIGGGPAVDPALLAEQTLYFENEPYLWDCMVQTCPDTMDLLAP